MKKNQARKGKPAKSGSSTSRAKAASRTRSPVREKPLIKDSGGWPALTRAVLMRPARREYVRKVQPEKGCVFCLALKMGRGQDSLVVFEGVYSMAILNKFPYNTGHLLVLPRQHEGDLTGLSAVEYEEVSWLVREAARLMKETYRPEGLNIGLNWGKAAGAGIPEHLHFHIIPRWSGDTNFFPLIAETKVVIETVEQTYARLAPLFSELKRLEPIERT